MQHHLKTGEYPGGDRVLARSRVIHAVASNAAHAAADGENRNLRPPQPHAKTRSKFTDTRVSDTGVTQNSRTRTHA